MRVVGPDEGPSDREAELHAIQEGLRIADPGQLLSWIAMQVSAAVCLRQVARGLRFADPVGAGKLDAAAEVLEHGCEVLRRALEEPQLLVDLALDASAEVRRATIHAVEPGG